MTDDFVMKVMDQIVAFAHAHPNQFDLAPELVNVLG